MKRFATRGMLGLAVLAMLGSTLTPFYAQGITYRIDPVHSTVIFRVKHMNTAFVYGRFNQFSGTLVVDEKNPERSSVQFEIDLNSVDTGNAQRDDHLRSPDFFNTRQFPKATFKSTRVRKINNTTVEVQGNLTLRGVTKPLTVRVTFTGKGRNPRGQEIIGFETTFTIKRSEFGINYGLNGGLSDEVRLTVSVEAIRQ
ncbi:MAG: YceI family protein [Fimbriimonadales bacterium]|nr:YceI family protein [Fimbriimonadales bacterium]CUU07929.1 Polyisoprenoid-binding protein YceI [Armatimonadetes bacterium GBS]CUU34566.1 Polyisoprenoid-binding protein YceI [Armatimonadetes bacterium DC]CUU37979.1 Polyisoprenoid-binding protein YceI [Armatimonadetes bacterium GXS]GBC89795.1 Protein YceI [bacterium HR14]